MVRKRRLRKSDGGDLEVHEQTVVSSYQAVVEGNIVSSNPLQIVIFSHQVIAEQIIASFNQPIGEQNVASLDMKIRN